MTSSTQTVFYKKNWVKQYSGPLYKQLRDHLEESIKSSQIKAGDSLPSEREIAEIADISRITVRRAVQALVKDGLVIQKQGSGTSVAPSFEKVQQPLSRLTSFTEDMARRSLKVKSTFLEKGLFTPSPEEIMALGLKSTSLVARIWRLREADNIPLAIERASLSVEHLPDPENVGASLYAHLSKYKTKPVRAIQRISAASLTREDARLLDVKEGVAGLIIERLSYLKDGQIVEFTRSVYRGDAYDFVAELQIGETDR